MPRISERYRFVCGRCGERFNKQDWPVHPRLRIVAGGVSVALSLGLWLVVWAISREVYLALAVTTASLELWLVLWAIWQWGLIYTLSRCPVCSRRSRRLLVTFVILLLISVDVVGSYYYLIEIAPGQIAERSADPEPLSQRENSIVFLSLAAGQYGLLVLFAWFAIFSVVLLYSPNRFRVSPR